MKCPKCGYLGFESVDRCRNCGYEFPKARVEDVPELPLRNTGEPDGLLDLDLAARPYARGPERTRPLPAPNPAHSAPVPQRRESVDELPLFGGGGTESRLAATALPPRPPLAVRRATPEVRYVQPEQPRGPMLDLDPGDLAAERPRQTAGRLEPRLREQGTPRPAADTASVSARLTAGLIDLATVAALDALVVYLTLEICGVTLAEFAIVPVVPLLAFLLLQNGGYLVAFTLSGQTLGKMALGLRVVPVAGARMDTGRAALRAFVWALMALPAGLGFASVLLDRDRRGWHDHSAGTRVVRAGEA